MAKFSEQVAAFGIKTTEKMVRVNVGVVNDLSELMTRRQSSVKETGGAFREGFVPVDTGELVNSHGIGIDLGDSVTPGATYSVEMADVSDVVVSGFTAPHAQAMEYGFRIADDLDATDTQYAGGDVDVPGRFFVRGAVQAFEDVVRENARVVASE